MILPAFDSHEYVKQLTANGVELPTAEVLADIRSEIRVLERAIEDFRKEVDLRFAQFEARMDAQFASFKAEMVRWLFAFFVVQTGAILTLRFI